VTKRITIHTVPETRRTELDTMALAYYREILPQGPPFFPAALDRYWIEAGRHPYLIAQDGVSIGFALVWNHRDGTHELTEFTVQPAFRHLGIGTVAALLVFESLGGDWVLGVAKQSPGGMAFWQQALETGENVTEITQGPPRTVHQVGSFSFRIER